MIGLGGRFGAADLPTHSPTLKHFGPTSRASLIEIGNKTNNIDEIGGQYMGLLKFTPQGWIEVEMLARHT